MIGMTHVLEPDAPSAYARPIAGPLPPYDDVTRSDSAFRTFLHGLPGVDQVGAEQRAAQLGTRSIKTTAKAWRSEEHTSELQSRQYLVCRLLLEKKKNRLLHALI